MLVIGNNNITVLDLMMNLLIRANGTTQTQNQTSMIAPGIMEASMDLKVITVKVTTAITVEIKEWTPVITEDIILVSIKNQLMMSTKQLNSNFWLMRLQTKDMTKKHSVIT